MRHNLMTLNPLDLLTGSLDRLFDFPVPAVEWSSVDTVRKGDEVTVEALVPGAAKDSIELSFEEGWLTIRGNAAEPERNENSRIHLQEIRRGEFVKRVWLGSDLDPSSAEARVENGVLRVTMKVAESAKPRRIEIR